MNVGNEIRVQTANQRERGTRDTSIARKQPGPTAHADASERDRKQMEAIYLYPDFDSADRNKGSLRLGRQR